jgi:hypothetical protein
MRVDQVLSSTLKILIRAEEAMQSAWYELDPNPTTIGTQFITQPDMSIRLKEVRSTIDLIKQYLKDNLNE